jgi:hypothetical protein
MNDEFEPWLEGVPGDGRHCLPGKAKIDSLLSMASLQGKLYAYQECLKLLEKHGSLEVYSAIVELVKAIPDEIDKDEGK